MPDHLKTLIDSVLERFKDLLVLDAPTMSLTRDLLCGFLEHKRQSLPNSAHITEVSLKLNLESRNNSLERHGSLK